MKCRATDCLQPLHARELCAVHYARFRRSGTVELRRAANRGASTHPLYRSFAGMKRRCYDKNNNRYERYGGRGIRVCSRWLEPQGFWNFVADMGPRPGTGYSLDRIDNDGDYEPGNCRWATFHQQASNRRNSNSTVGVAWHKKAKKWVAQVYVRNEPHYLGLFSAYSDAVAARKSAERFYGIH